MSEPTAANLQPAPPGSATPVPGSKASDARPDAAPASVAATPADPVVDDNPPGSTEVSEIRYVDIERVIAFAAERGVTVAPSRIVHHLSTKLVGLDAADAPTELLAVALCCRSPRAGHDLWLVMGDLVADADTARLMLDKTMLKIQSAGISWCNLKTPEPEDAHGFWAQARWRDAKSRAGRRDDGVDRSTLRLDGHAGPDTATAGDAVDSHAA